MTKTNHFEVRSENRCSLPAALPDRKTLAEAVDEALKQNRFCDPERTLIVQIVCDTLAKSLPHNDA